MAASQLSAQSLGAMPVLVQSPALAPLLIAPPPEMASSSKEASVNSNLTISQEPVHVTSQLPLGVPQFIPIATKTTQSIRANVDTPQEKIPMTPGKSVSLPALNSAVSPDKSSAATTVKKTTRQVSSSLTNAPIIHTGIQNTQTIMDTTNSAHSLSGFQLNKPGVQITLPFQKSATSFAQSSPKPDPSSRPDAASLSGASSFADLSRLGGAPSLAPSPKVGENVPSECASGQPLIAADLNEVARATHTLQPAEANEGKRSGLSLNLKNSNASDSNLFASSDSGISLGKL